MKTRQNFLYWLEQSEILKKVTVHAARFYRVEESLYVFECLQTLEKEVPELTPQIHDFRAVEERRYRILEIDISQDEDFFQKKKTAINFASLADVDKRQSRFRIPSNLSDFLVTSEYDWARTIQGNDMVAQKKQHYFFVPSFLPMMPKEVPLIEFSAVFLDLINFDEEFTYIEFFHLVRETLDASDEEIDRILLEFLSNQILYYETILYIP